ncbi:hypothetical protein J2847_005349 [Azospirillum agricola]|uniref:hypothetical protein n=1 Tax=Azospirillum agricola TaxID=1720247 RepID=UPI001AE71BD4|nr:hypothetical protein [Azospirillum agricola]MBP2232024.1 hypothetical protein [Azospirillum agricola]
MASATLDHHTLEAIAVLARAVERERVPGVLEFRLLTNALNRAADSRSERELNEAARVFKTLEPELRVRIVERAKAEAHAQVRAGRADATTLEIPALDLSALDTPAPSARPTVRTVKAAGSSFLAALNGLRPTGVKSGPKVAGGAAPDSRDAAKDRLRAAVETQRALPETAPDVGYDRGLRPGVRLPRAT